MDGAKRAAAKAAVDEYVREGMVVGIGSGSTIVFAVEYLATLSLNVTCVPTSFQSRLLILQHGLRLSDLTMNPVIDVAIDGADEVDPQLNCIKGGGGALLQEKVVAYNAKRFVVIADYKKRSGMLGKVWRTGIPIEVVPFAYVTVMNKVKEMGGTPVLRAAKAKAGPVVTDNGNFIVDADFGAVDDVATLDAKLQLIPGVMETGLFIGLAEKAIFGNEDGTVSHIVK